MSKTRQIDHHHLTLLHLTHLRLMQALGIPLKKALIITEFITLVWLNFGMAYECISDLDVTYNYFNPLTFDP